MLYDGIYVGMGGNVGHTLRYAIGRPHTYALGLPYIYVTVTVWCATPAATMAEQVVVCAWRRSQIVPALSCPAAGTCS